MQIGLTTLGHLKRIGEDHIKVFVRVVNILLRLCLIKHISYKLIGPFLRLVDSIDKSVSLNVIDRVTPA